MAAEADRAVRTAAAADLLAAQADQAAQVVPAGPAAQVAMKGSVDLNHETQNLTVRIQPAFGETVATGMLLINPVTGLATWAVNKLFGRPLDEDLVQRCEAASASLARRIRKRQQRRKTGALATTLLVLAVLLAPQSSLS